MIITEQKPGMASGIAHAASSAGALTVTVAGLDSLIWAAGVIHSTSSPRRKTIRISTDVSNYCQIVHHEPSLHLVHG